MDLYLMGSCHTALLKMNDTIIIDLGPMFEQVCSYGSANVYATPYDILKLGTQHISDVGIKGTLNHVRLQIPDMRHQPIEVLDDS